MTIPATSPSTQTRIYVDLDDVLCETIGALTRLLAEEWGRRVEVDEVRHFDLGRSFGLDPDQLASFLRRAHEDTVIESLAPLRGAAETLAHWREQGYAISVLTGRPIHTRASSRRWLALHGIAHAHFDCVDKYGRGAGAAPAPSPDEPPLPFERVSDFGFHFAVEDSLAVATRLVRDCGLTVALYDRPWNRDLSGVAPAVRARLVRVRDWDEIRARFDRP